MNQQQRTFLDKATEEATKCNHPFPKMAACEAALESSWGNSELAREGYNLFGTKQHSHPIYGTLNLPTREWSKDGQLGDGQWTTVEAHWVQYPDLAACFADRLETLQRLSNAYPHYKAALDAKDESSYISEVSKTWSTDPHRADKVLSIYRDYIATSS